MIMVTGATGNVGRQVLAPHRPGGLDVATGSLDDPGGLDAALTGWRPSSWCGRS